MFAKALLYGLIWSALWMVYIYILLKRFPWEMVHEYPDDIKKACTIPAPTSGQKRTGKLAGGIYSLFLFALLILFGLEAYRHADFSYLRLFGFLWVVAFVWNLLDLLVMDWLIVCTVTPRWVVLEGTEGCRGYKDYGFHWKGFLTGCIYTTIIAALFAGIDYVLLRWVI
jgi:hypothetical protein